MRWILGRQNSGYWKFKIFDNHYFDTWLVKYPTGSSIPQHVDVIEGHTHTRVNIILQKPISGGVFKCDNVKTLFDRIHIFRSDINKHSVSTITDGVRIVISIGIFRKIKGDTQ